MSDETPAKAGAWTDEAKYQLTLRIIAQLKEEGRTINWSRIVMEGRTTKSLKNQWTKMAKEIAELENMEKGGAGVGTPTKAKATREDFPVKLPAKSAGWIAANGGHDSDDDTPKKRVFAPLSPGTPGKKIKTDDTIKSDEDSL
ncbi:hypothetical protein CP533_3226 [Ophiocordyceps camponoti-saundersi (nom. inval.)]|nr:hypothetical protein CP533_3226 [Ophiocordyceps camponoti-saundersi (nom. inval.)]